MKKIIGAAIGSCVHVSGLNHFLKIAESEGFSTVSCGPAVPVKRLIGIIRDEKPDIIALSYRLTPDSASGLFDELKRELVASGMKGQRMIFGGTPPVVAVASVTGLFERLFDGTEPPGSVREYLRGGGGSATRAREAETLTGRIGQKYPYPLLRHHFGRPTVQETLDGVEKVAYAGVLDIISLGPDQNAQEHFFHPEEMDHSQDGAGGVPLRSAADLEAIYSRSRCGNYPLVRCYAGTRDQIRWAEMSVATINNAWGAIPLCWYSVADGRSGRTVEEAMTEHRQVMSWYAARDIPVEVNESHQWSLRDAHDSLAVAMAFLAAYNARKAGVRDYVSQYMFNTPPGTSAEMDIAKMLAKQELIGGLVDPDFKVWREVRAGLAHFSSNPCYAKGQLAASSVISLALQPHILHVVGFSEGDHAIYPEELIESCDIVHGVLHNTLHGLPDLTSGKRVGQRRKELVEEAGILLEALHDYGNDRSEDPWSDPGVIAGAIRTGLLDAPHFLKNEHLCGNIVTRLIDGAWYAVEADNGNIIGEKERTDKLKKKWQE
jgi:hypothetical protein